MPINGPFMWQQPPPQSYFAPPMAYSQAIRRRLPEFEPAPDPSEDTTSWMARLSNRLPKHGFEGMPQDSYKTALKDALIAAGASMVGRTEDPFTVLGEGLRTGLGAHERAIEEQAQSVSRNQAADRARADAEAQQAALEDVADPEQRARLSRRVGSEDFWEGFWKVTEPRERNVQKVGDALVDVPEEGDPREIYRAPAEEPKPELKKFGDELWDVTPGQKPHMTKSLKPSAKGYEDVTVKGARIRVYDDGRVQELYRAEGGPEEEGDKFDSSKETAIRSIAKVTHEAELADWKRRRVAAVEKGQDSREWTAANPGPTEGDALRQAAERMEREHGYRSIVLDEPVVPQEVPTRPVAGGPAEGIEGSVVAELEADSQRWAATDGVDPGWAKAQYDRLRAAHPEIGPAKAAEMVRQAYQRAKAATGG